MRIYDCTYSSIDGNKATIEMRLVDVTYNDAMYIRNLSLTGDEIKINRDDSWTEYIRGYVEMSKALHGRGKIEIRPYTEDIKVEKVIFNKPATIVFWSDGTKTVVVCGENDTYDPEKGFYIACAKKLFGNDYKAVGRMNKALEMAVVQTKEDKK